MAIMFVDIDGTLCTQGHKGHYELAQPHRDMIDYVNGKHDSGDTIVIWTARQQVCDYDIAPLTIAQLAAWGVKYDSIRFDKPVWDILLDDKTEDPEIIRACL